MGERTEPVEVECEHCGHGFSVERARGRKARCPKCGQHTLLPFRRAPMWFLAVAGMSLTAIVLPGLAYRLFGPTVALPVAGVSLAALWWFGRRM